VAAKGFGVGLWGFAREPHDERQWRQAEDREGEDGEGVFVAEHGGLAEHLLVGLTDGGLRCGSRGHAVGHHHFFHAVHVEAVRDAALYDVGGEGYLIHLCVAREIGGEERGSGAAAEVAGEVGEAGDLIGLAGGDTDIVERADGDEDEGEADDLQHAPEGDGAVGGVEVEASEVVDADGGDQVAEADHEAGVDFAERAASYEHHQHHDEAGGGEHHAGAFGGVAEESLEVLRNEDGAAEEDHAEDQLQEDGGAEVAIF
jgi:hypothetical protein